MILLAWLSLVALDLQHFLTLDWLMSSSLVLTRVAVRKAKPVRVKVQYLEIAVDHSLFMHIVNGLEDLADEVCSVLLRVRAFLDDPVKQLTARYSIHPPHEQKKEEGTKKMLLVPSLIDQSTRDRDKVLSLFYIIKKVHAAPSVFLLLLFSLLRKVVHFTRGQPVGYY